MATIVSYNNFNHNVFENPQATANACANLIWETYREKGGLNIALSGGSTPKLLFDILAMDYQDKIDWKNIHFYWGDERMVPPTHEESNYLMTHDLLLSRIEIPEENIHRVMGEHEPDMEARRYGDLISKNLPRANDLPVFDIVILGMGGDGHTASIFPPDLHLIEDKGVCAIGTNPDSGQKRVTLTGSTINNADLICFLVTGSGKSEKIDEIANQKSGYLQYPAAHVKANKGTLIWYLDEQAASNLN